MSYAYSRSQYSSQKPIIHTRESSTDSRTSCGSRSSADSHHTSSRSSMNGYNGSSYSRVVEERTYRIPNNESHILSSKVSRDGRVKVVEYNSKHYDPEAPRASDATYNDYKETQRHRSSKSRTQK